MFNDQILTIVVLSLQHVLYYNLAYYSNNLDPSFQCLVKHLIGVYERIRDTQKVVFVAYEVLYTPGDKGLQWQRI